MNSQLNRIYATQQVDIHRVQLWWQQIPVLIYVILQQRETRSDPSIGEDVVHFPVSVLGGFEHFDLLLPGRNIDFHEGDEGALGFREFIEITRENFATMFENAAESCEADA